MMAMGHLGDPAASAHGPTLPVGRERHPAADQLSAGAQVGDYVVEGFLGAGGMGAVYEGRHPVIGKRVAIKVLRRELALDPEAAERFTREARAVNQVAHGNVIDVFAFGRLPDERLYLVMDLVDGKSLRDIVSAGPVPVARALAILAQVAAALDAAHGKGVVHRDLKPDNVMLGDGDHVFVLDFGLAKLAAAGTAAKPLTLTEQGQWLGTPAYMAPEQWSADGAGPAADRYALGVMAFELLCGKVPFAGPSLPQMMEQHFRAAIPALSARGTAPTGDFDTVLAKALAKDPTARFATAVAFVDALRAATTRAPSRRRAGGWLPIAAGVGVLAVAAFAIVALRHGAREDEVAPAAAEPPRPAGASVALSSVPEKASVYRGKTLLGYTPVPVALEAGTRADLVMRKAGFRTEALTVDAADEKRVVQLVPQNGFEGVWVLPDGAIRSFKRADDASVDVYKLEALTATPAFYRRFVLEESERLVVFVATEALSEGSDPSCQIGFRVEYRFDPDRETLDVRQEHVDLTKRDGKCTAQARWLGDPIVLVRGDVISDGTEAHRTIVAPLGKPPVTKPPRRAATVPASNQATSSNGLSNAAPQQQVQQHAIPNEVQAPSSQPPPQAQKPITGD